MFTLQQIKDAHSKVKSGADFPAYIRELKSLGVTGYETYVLDGHTNYNGEGVKELVSAARYAPLTIATAASAEQFRNDLKKHQKGDSDYNQFIYECAEAGVEKWSISIEGMTCTYFDKSGREILVEQIPG